MTNTQTNKKTVRTFAWVSFLNDLGGDMVFPVWPIFMTQVLGVNMAVLGLIDGIGEAMVSISQAFSGYFSDRFQKRKGFIWIGYLFGAFARFGYAVTTTWPQALIFKVIDRSGKMRDAPRDAIVADASTPQDRGGNFGLINSFDHLGAVCGILMAIALVQLVSIRSIFLIASIPTFLGAALVYFKIREREPEQKVFTGFRFKDLTPTFRYLLFLSGLFSLGAFSYSFLLIFSQDFGFTLTFIPVLYLIYMVTASVSAYPFGWLSDIVGRKLLLLFSFLLWGATTGLLLLTQSEVAILMAFALFGFHKGTIDTAQRTIVSELAPTHLRSSYLGTFKMIVGLTAFPASLIAGLLWDKMGLFAPLVFSISMTGVAVLLLLPMKLERASS